MWKEERGVLINPSEGCESRHPDGNLSSVAAGSVGFTARHHRQDLHRGAVSHHASPVRLS